LETFTNLFNLGFLNILNLSTMFFLVAGIFGGIVFGAIPGLTAVMGVTVMLPFTFFMNPINALVLLTGIYLGGISGGLISATLLNMPGTPSSVSTCFDGYPMAQKGKAGEALGLGIMSSVLGGIGSSIILAFAAPFLAWKALMLGPFEYFSLGIFTYLTISSLLGGNFWKNMIGIGLGIVIACIGVDPITGLSRLTLGFSELNGGVSILPFLIGLFCVSQIMEDMKNSKDVIVPTKARNIKLKDLLPNLRIFIIKRKVCILSFLTGLFLGILPGIGGSTANVVSYHIVRSNSKHPEKFGTGIPEGIIASEMANNASIGGAFVPFLALGIPGCAVTAIMLGAFMMQGIQPGPLVFQNHKALVFTIISALIIGHFLLLGMNLLLIKIFIQLLSISKKYLLPLITIACVIGSFSCNNRMFDVWILITFGLLGYLLRKVNFNLVPILVGYILAGFVEIGIREGLSISDGSFLPIFTRPISAILVTLSILVVIFGFAFNKKLRESADI